MWAAKIAKKIKGKDMGNCVIDDVEAVQVRVSFLGCLQRISWALRVVELCKCSQQLPSVLNPYILRMLKGRYTPLLSRVTLHIIQISRENIPGHKYCDASGHSQKDNNAHRTYAGNQIETCPATVVNTLNAICSEWHKRVTMITSYTTKWHHALPKSLDVCHQQS